MVDVCFVLVNTAELLPVLGTGAMTADSILPTLYAALAEFIPFAADARRLSIQVYGNRRTIC